MLYFFMSDEQYIFYLIFIHNLLYKIWKIHRKICSGFYNRNKSIFHDAAPNKIIFDIQLDAAQNLNFFPIKHNALFLTPINIHEKGSISHKSQNTALLLANWIIVCRADVTVSIENVRYSKVFLRIPTHHDHMVPKLSHISMLEWKILKSSG